MREIPGPLGAPARYVVECTTSRPSTRKQETACAFGVSMITVRNCVVTTSKPPHSFSVGGGGDPAAPRRKRETFSLRDATRVIWGEVVN